MTDIELDQAYTDFCRAIGNLSGAALELALGRFALLAILEIDDPSTVARLATQAAGDQRMRVAGTVTIATPAHDSKKRP
jgi:hypothetical protein